MGNARSTKRDIDKARQEKAAAKRERRHSREPGDAVSADTITETGQSQEEILAALAELHERFAAETMSFEDFEAAKNELVERLGVN